MATMTYKEQLLHPNWQKKRLEAMKNAGFQCECCGDTETTLNVHHKRYVKGRKVWEYPLTELACLCQPCHEKEHSHREQLDSLLVQCGGRLPDIVALIAGYLDGDLFLDEPPAPEIMNNQAYGLGILASILDCQLPDARLRAFKGTGIVNTTPTQESELDRWSDFAVKLERSGL